MAYFTRRLLHMSVCKFHEGLKFIFTLRIFGATI